MQSLLCESVGHSARLAQDCSASLAICTATIRIDFSNIVFDHIREVVEVAKENCACPLTISSQTNYKAFKAHLAEQLYKGGGTYLKSIRAEDKQYLTVDYTADGGTDRSPSLFSKTQCTIFCKYWSPKMTDEEQSVLISNLITYREYALENVDSTQHTPTSYKTAIHHYNNSTRGSDGWHMKTLKELPDVCISNIVDAMKLSVDLVASPHQSLCSLNSCSGKPGGGVRTISKLPMTNRLYNKVSTNVSVWEQDLFKNVEGAYEIAKKCFSALDAALYRNKVAEIAYWLNQIGATALNDFHKLFDTINVNNILTESIHCEYPPLI